MEHIKVVFRGCTFGPLRAPTTIRSLCAVLKVSPRASPTLQSMDRPDPIIVVDYDASVGTGLYELLAQPGVDYDEAVDGPVVRMARTAAPVHAAVTPSTAQPVASSADFPVMRAQQDDHDTMIATPSTKNLPLDSSEMSACVQAMIHLISAIPPRYVKYNRILATQIDRAMLEVDRLRSNLDRLVIKMHATAHSPVSPSTPPSSIAAPGTPDTTMQNEYTRLQTVRRQRHRQALPISIIVTFTQYRIVHTLYETWKTAWKRFSPAARSFNISKIETAHAVDTAEHYLNRLWMWRRILDARMWTRLQYAAVEQDKRVGLPPLPTAARVVPTSVDRLMNPPPLPSGKHPHAWEYMVQTSGDLDVLEAAADATGARDAPRVVRLDGPAALREFRQVFVASILRHGLYRDDELDCLLEELIVLDRAARKMTLALGHGVDGDGAGRKDHADADASDDPPGVLVYPADFIREEIRREFRINWSSLDEERASSRVARVAASATQSARLNADVAAHARVRDVLGPHRKSILERFRSAASSASASLSAAMGSARPAHAPIAAPVRAPRAAVRVA